MYAHLFAFNDEDPGPLLDAVRAHGPAALLAATDAPPPMDTVTDTRVAVLTPVGSYNYAAQDRR